MSMDISTTILKSIYVHYVGNKGQGDGLTLSDKELEVGIDLASELKSYFLTKFNGVFDSYHFGPQTQLKEHVVYQILNDYWSEAIPFQDMSQKIAQHLFESSMHPKVKPGELYICHFENVAIENKQVDVIGIFKTETKNGFLDVSEKKGNFSISYKEGIDIHKLDKGCLIFNSKKKDGYIIKMIDHQNRGEEALYWKETFLGLVQLSNDFHQTNQFLNIAKSYVTKQVPEDFEVSKTDQIDLLNRSVEYFKNHETFDKEEFENEVFQHKSIIESFRNYDQSYREHHDIDVPDSFEISEPAVKKQTRVFKSVLKLDKNFHIYIHGNKNMIEPGVDEDGRKYYKIYYENEA